jgi:hypothetical protein
LRQGMTYRPVEVIRDLRDLAGGDERADGHQAPISRRQGRTQPQVMEQDVAGILHESRGYRTDILLNTGRALRLGGLIDGKKRTCGRRKLVGSGGPSHTGRVGERHPPDRTGTAAGRDGRTPAGSARPPPLEADHYRPVATHTPWLWLPAATDLENPDVQC